MKLAELVESMQLGDGSGPPNTGTGPLPVSVQNIHAGMAPNPSVIGIPTSLDPGQQLLNPPPSFLSPTNTTSEPILTVDSTDMSRKRCASSVATDRVLKAMKLEPQDDVSLQNAPSTSLHATSLPISPFSFVTSTPLPATILEQPSLPPSIPPSVPASRPQSPRLSLSSLSHPSDSQLPNPPSLHAGLTYHPLDPSQPIPHSVEFVAAPLQPAVVPTPVSAGFTPTSIPPTPTSWPDSRTAFQRHSHSLSGSSVLGLPPQVGINVAGPSTLPPFAATHSVVYSPTRAAHPPHTAIPIAPVATAPLGTRLSRSSSISNPFAFSAAGEHAAPGYEPLARSRPPTSGQFSTRPSSPDYDDVDRDDDSDEGPGSSPPQAGHHPSPGREDYANESMEGIQSAASQTAVNSQRRMSRTSPSAEGTNGISGHANEVPQEYRAEVERIFFEFLTRICSNREISFFLEIGVKCITEPSACSRCYRCQRRAYSSDIDGKEDATSRRVSRFPSIQIPYPGVHQCFPRRGMS